MKRLFYIILLVVLLGVGYQNRTVLAEQMQHVGYYSICDSPIKYKVGTIDERFNITREEFIRSIDEAGTIWSTAEGKQLFVYDPEGPLTISLQYDERQSLNSKINQMDSKLDQQNKELEPEIKQYEARAADFKRKAAALNNEIEGWNGKGGAPKEVYDGLVARQKALQQESRELQDTAAELGQSTQSYNDEVHSLSQTVETYNEALKFKPEEGIYIQDQEGRRIIIYFYNTHTELVHTITHEFGHALGMDHNNDASAIMFSKTNNAVNLAEADQASLKEACRRRSVIEIAQSKIKLIVANLKQPR